MVGRSLTPPPAREAHGAGVANGEDGQLAFEALGSAAASASAAAAVVVATRGGSTEEAGGERGGVAMRSNGGRDEGFAAGMRTVRRLSRDYLHGVCSLCGRLMLWLLL